MSSFRGSSGPKDLTCVSRVDGWILHHWATWGARRHSCCCCSVAKSCLTLCIPMNCSMPGFPVLHYLPEFVQTHVHWVSDAIQPSRPLSPSPPAFNLSQHQGLFQRVSSSHQVAKVLELQLQLSPSSEEYWAASNASAWIRSCVASFAELSIMFALVRAVYFAPC